MYTSTLLLEHRRARNIFSTTKWRRHKEHAYFTTHTALLYYMYMTTLLHTRSITRRTFRARMSQSLDEAQERYEKIVKDRDLKVSLLNPLLYTTNLDLFSTPPT